MSHICFVTYEFFPGTPGGCGTLLHNVAQMLLARGHSVTLLVDFPHHELKILRHKIPQWPHAERLHVHHVDEALPADLWLEDFASIFEKKAYRFHVAADTLHNKESFDIIEFFDYCGPAFYALRAQRAGLAFHNALLSIRLHNSLEVMDACEGSKIHDGERVRAFALEHGALRLAKRILYPGESYLKFYKTFYEPWQGTTVFAPPPLRVWPLKKTQEHVRKRRVLFFGRIFAWKGIDVYVDASVAWLKTHPDSKLLFTVVGYDSCATPTGHATYVEYLQAKIPAALLHHFQFTGQIAWADVERLLPEVCCAVFPSYAESFGYAAHEMHAAGIPVLLSRIPAFLDHFIEGGESALFFTLNTQGLYAAFQRFFSGDTTKHFLASPRPPQTSEVHCAPYEGIEESTLSFLPKDKDIAAPTITVIVLTQDTVDESTLSSLRHQQGATKIELIFAKTQLLENAVQAWWLGELVQFTTATGKPLLPTSLTVGDFLLVLRNGDVLNEAFLPTTLYALRNSATGYAGAWAEVWSDAHTMRVDTYPLDAMLAEAVFDKRDPQLRQVMRAESGTLLIDYFQQQLGRLGELGRLMALEDAGMPGVTIPTPLLRIRQRDVEPQRKAQALLVLQNTNPHRARAWARKLVSGV